MMLDQRLQCFLHPFRIKALFGVKHHRLVPVVLVREVLFKEPALDRRQDDFALHRALVCLFAFGTLYILGKLLDRRMLEEIFHFQLPAVLIQAARHLNSFDGISAKREEIVGDTDFRHSKHVLPDAGKQLFHVGRRRFVFSASRFDVRLRQGFAVHLAVCRNRKLVQRHPERRDHVIRQGFLQC
ncbi:Uncharacterised protein [Streptococcus pneumoniae]|nr:Uncharacterised protein [Streptococcus pneumoniae]